MLHAPGFRRTETLSVVASPLQNFRYPAAVVTFRLGVCGNSQLSCQSILVDAGAVPRPLYVRLVVLLVVLSAVVPLSSPAGAANDGADGDGDRPVVAASRF